jgi:hypothetical protein
MLHNKDNSPLFAIHFANFFEPYFSSREMVDIALKELKHLGINSIILDSKLWSDFSEYFKIGKESPYVSMQKYIVNKCREQQLGVSFLALYLCGDNLYPKIYDNPPEFVDQPTDLNGDLIRGYKLWSDAQIKEQICHCLNLYKHIAKDIPTKATDDTGRERLPFYFYHDPAFCPSFNKDDIEYYLTWLKKKYSLEQLNERYKTSFKSFDEVGPKEYWLNPVIGKEFCYDHQSTPTVDDYKQRNVNVLKYADNQLFKLYVMKGFFEKLNIGLKKSEPGFYLYPSLNQWKYFFNDHSYWDTGKRVVDVWELGSVVDTASFTTYAIDTFGDVNPYVVSCELAMMRSANGFKDYVAGLFMGRYMFNDIYSFLSPSEVLAIAFSAGATDLFFYGYSGLDDGGSMGKWQEDKKKSFKDGLDWFSNVRAVAGKRIRDKKAAIVFPFATYLLQHNKDDHFEYACNRNDLLGWYNQLADLGLNADIIHPSQVKQGILEDYSIVVMPANPMYWAMPDEKMESFIKDYVVKGGLLFRSASACCEKLFKIEAIDHEHDSIQWHEKIITDSYCFKSFANEKVIATFMADNKAAISEQFLGKGKIISFGFDYGYAYCLKKQKPVPSRYGKDNHYPLTVIKETPVEFMLREEGLAKESIRGIERVMFENGILVINHTPYPYDLAKTGRNIATTGLIDNSLLPSHSAVFMKVNN